MNDTINIKPEVIKMHLLNYSNSLKNYSDKYLHLFFVDINNVPEHFAYICPLCLKTGIIAEQSIGLGMSAEFSLDHYPPESVGGFQSILVCKKCNNDAGRLYDFSLKEKIKNIAFNNKTPASNLNSKSKISNVTGNYPSKLSINENGEIEISLKPNEKIHAPFLDEFIEYSKVNSDYKIELTYKIADENKVLKALVKAAYLFCFDCWGYDFVFSNTGEMIRKFLHDESEYPVKNPSFWLGSLVKSKSVEKLPLGLCYLKKPLEWRSFIVNIQMFDTETNYGEIASVLIPGPDEKDWEDLKRIQSLLDKSPQVDISLAHVTENLLNNNIMDGYRKSWELLNSTLE